jgi:hypothetical protein
MSKLGILGAAALSLALAVATPAFAAGVRGSSAMHVGSQGVQDSSLVSSGTDASNCAQRYMYYDRASGMAMGDDGQWRPCP